MDEQPFLLTVPEVARLLRVSRAFAYELIARGEIPVVRFGRRVLIPRQQLEEQVRASATGTSSDR